MKAIQTRLKKSIKSPCIDMSFGRTEPSPKSAMAIMGQPTGNHGTTSVARNSTLQGMDTYPTKREVGKIIDSKCHFGGIC